MKVLAIDTTASTATVALTVNGKLIADYSIQTLTHSTTLLPMISSVLRDSGNTVDDIDLFAVSTGPGSFTGVRIGVAAVKGLAYKNNTPCIGVSSLEAMAYNFIGVDGRIMPVINARSGRVYTAEFLSDNGKVSRLSEDDVIEIKSLEFEEGTIITGDGIDVVKSGLGDEIFSQFTLVPDIMKVQNAYGVALLGEKIYTETEDKSVFTESLLAPSYLRKSQAERERDERISRENGEK